MAARATAHKALVSRETKGDGMSGGDRAPDESHATWDQVLNRPSRWGLLAVVVSIVIGVLASIVLWWPGSELGPWQAVWAVVALSVPQLFFRVHGAALLAAVAMVAGIYGAAALWGGQEIDLASTFSLLAAAAAIEVVNLFGTQRRWGMRRGLQGAVLGTIVLLVVLFLGLDVGALASRVADQAYVGAVLAGLVFVPLILVASAVIYVVVRLIASFAVAGFENARRGSARPTTH